MSRRGMIWFISRRLLAMVALLIVLSFAIFSLLYISPGNVVDILLGTNPRTPETVRILRHEYHLDQPFLTQYWIWAREAIRFHFGNSIQSTLPVTEELKTRFPTTLFLGLYAYALTMLAGVGFGVLAALRRRTTVDRSIVGVGIVALSTPAFVVGVFLLYVFAIAVHWFPAFGAGGGFWDRVWHLTLPAVSLALVSAAYVLKHTRASMIGALDQDYVTFARARGLSSRRILMSYALRNALIPVVTISGLTLGFLITGAVIVEVTFSLPGIGQLLVQAATTKDLPMVQGVAMLAAVLIMVTNLLTDIVYMLVDPRIRLGRSSG